MITRDHALYFQIAPYRVDLTREADLIEELARLDGYDKIPRKKAVQRIMDRHAHRVRREIEDHFAQAGFCEMLNYSFSDPEQLTAINFPPNEAESKLLRLVNPQSSNQSAMRVSLLPQLLANLNYNLNHGERDLKVMEMGKLYWKDGNSYREPLHLTALLTGKTGLGHWQDKPADIGFFHVKGIAESLLDKLGLQVASSCEDQQPWLTAADNLAFYCADTLCACLGRLKSEIAEKAGIDIHNLKQDIWVLDVEVENLIGLTRDSQPRFVPLPRYPAVTRDISFVIDLTVPYAKIAAAIEAVDPRLISSVSVFDEYRGKQVPTGQRSLSLRLMLQDKEKTLTDERVEQVVASVLKMLESTWQIQMR